MEVLRGMNSEREAGDLQQRFAAYGATSSRAPRGSAGLPENHNEFAESLGPFSASK
jgi:hypothetical protein